ncbi:mCG126624, isoform CRA_b [Mus musculus]|nr:mCG126624, isoform CRA_b [Mus musculus]
MRPLGTRLIKDDPHLQSNWAIGRKERHGRVFCERWLPYARSPLDSWLLSYSGSLCSCVT